MGFRLHIDGDWDAADFAAFFSSLDDLHNYLSLSLEYDDLRPGRAYAYGFRRGPTDTRYSLSVEKIKYGSPGFTDLAGLAAAMREIRELIQFIIDHCSRRKDRKLERDKNKLEIANLRLDLLARLLEVEAEYGSRMPIDAEKYFGLKSNGLPDIDPLIDAAIKERLTGISDSEDKKQ